MSTPKPVRQRKSRGFRQAAALVDSDIRKASESRGFAVARLLTHWADIVGTDTAKIARPVEVSYGRGFGATLTLLTTGPSAPMLEMQKDRIREKVNACYGYAAISRIRITQTAAQGFSEGQVAFAPAPDAAGSKPPEIVPEARQKAAAVTDPDLRAALERLGSNVLSARKS